LRAKASPNNTALSALFSHNWHILPISALFYTFRTFRTIRSCLIMHCACVFTGHCSGQVPTSPTPCPRRRGRSVDKVWAWRGQSARM